MAKLISKLLKAKEEYLTTVAEIEDKANHSFNQEAKKIIEQVMIHEEIALDHITS